MKEHYGLPVDGYRSSILPAYNSGIVYYNYSYQLNSFILGVAPYYNILNKKWFSLDLGVGLNTSYTKLMQEGVNMDYHSLPYETKQDNKDFTSWNLSGQGSINLGFQLSEHFAIDANIKYSVLKIENIGAENLYWIEYDAKDKNSSTYPISETTIDLSGFNYMLRLRYCWNK